MLDIYGIYAYLDSLLLSRPVSVFVFVRVSVLMSVSVRGSQAAALFFRKNYEEALALYRRALETNPRAPAYVGYHLNQNCWC